MATEEFPIEPAHLVLGIILAFVCVLALTGLAILAWWVWQQRHRLPNAKARIEREWRALAREAEGQRDQESQRARAALADAAQAKQREAKAAQDLQAAHNRIAALEAAQGEVRAAMGKLEDKALAITRQASQEAAAKAAEAQRLQRDLEAATQAHRQAAEAGRKALALFEDLQGRHEETLRDLAVLRDCDHQEQATVYTRETDPATNSRPYRSQGLLCKRCRYVQPGPANGAPAAMPAVAAVG